MVTKTTEKAEMSGTGIAGAADHGGIRHQQCPTCGIAVGDRKQDGKKLQCLGVARAVFGVGVVSWCSTECAAEWLAPIGRLP